MEFKENRAQDFSDELNAILKRKFDISELEQVRAKILRSDYLEEQQKESFMKDIDRTILIKQQRDQYHLEEIESLKKIISFGPEELVAMKSVIPKLPYEESEKDAIIRVLTSLESGATPLPSVPQTPKRSMFGFFGKRSGGRQRRTKRNSRR